MWRVQKLLLFLRIQKPAAVECLINSDTQPSTRLLPLPCFIPEARTKCTCYLKHQEARQRSASTDGIAGSARNTCETEILSRLLGEVVASAPSCLVFFFLPSNQRGERLQKRKRFVMLTEMTWPKSEMIPSSHPLPPH